MKDNIIDNLNELKEQTEYELWRALNNCRKQEFYVPMESIIKIIKSVLDEEEVKALKEKL